MALDIESNSDQSGTIDIHHQAEENDCVIVPFNIENETDYCQRILLDDSDNSDDDITEKSDNACNTLSICNQLRLLAINHNASHALLNDVLKIFNTNNLSAIKLPMDSRTLMHTPRSVEINEMGHGQFWYNGIEKSLRKSWCNLKCKAELNLIFNIDGLPIYKSSSLEFWPILCTVHGEQQVNPMVVAIYSGKGKPPLEPFLRGFVEELNKLLLSGIKVQENISNVKVKYFVCDTPARNYILGKFIKSRNKYLNIILITFLK